MARRRARETASIPVTESNGNIFADLGVAHPEEELIKVQLVSHVRHTIKRRRLMQLQTGRLMGLDQPKVSALMDGRLAGVSSGRPLRLLAALGQDVEIVVKAGSRRRARGQVRVVEAV